MTDDRGRSETLGSRERLACELLLEALHKARARTGEPGPPPTAEPTEDEDSEVDCELTAHGRQLFHTLWPQPVAATRLRRMLDVVQRYVDRAEALARRRDGLLHDYRAEHGFDRAAYTAEEADQLATALATLEAEARGRLHGAARELLEAEEPTANQSCQED